MSIFDFVKEAGQKLLHLGGEPSSGTAATTATAGSGPELGQQIEAKLESYLQSLNLGIDSPKVRVEGDKVTLEGKAASQEAMEKAVLALGNTHGIAQVDSRLMTTADTQAQDPRFYTVKSGDTLSKIAKEFYGDAQRYQQIFDANRPMLKSADAIYPGQNLRIPADKTQTNAA